MELLKHLQKNWLKLNKLNLLLTNSRIKCAELLDTSVIKIVFLF